MHPNRSPLPQPNNLPVLLLYVWQVMHPKGGPSPSAQRVTSFTPQLVAGHATSSLAQRIANPTAQDALKNNALNSKVNQQEAEKALSKWFTGARDRGGQRASRMHQRMSV
ncbi:hypothetical protein E1301_Tti018759 [Triplophysa tibetana]|uniref:Uncharacterized protein n=1 Tax=Triplophysa tibetana TaxID=1572043 RepID=A0A5A9NGS8_9TELE|nr:hypothetical protein E1301_Tti018759 [Triplophysa tibetana]